MAETVGSAVIGETVSTIISSISRKAEEKTDLPENIERLEIAHIKLEAALDMSKKWQISSIPLLRWRRKLKLAAQECDNVLRRSKQHATEEQDTMQQISQSSFPKRIAHATKSLVSSLIPFGKDEPPTISSSDIQRFERFADGAKEFLKFVEFGGTPRQYMFSDPLIGHLLTGKSVRYQVVQGSKLSYFGIRSMNFAERGVEAMIGFIVVDFKDHLKGLVISFILRISDSTDVFGVMIKCMQSVTPHHKFVAEHVKRELIQLPTQDFSFLLHSPYVQSDYWSNIHSTLTKWCRPNPLCCNENNFRPCCSTSNTIGSSSPRMLCDAFPEEVIMVLLQCRILLPDQHRYMQSSATPTDLGGGSSLNPNVHPLKLGILFMPHDSPEDIDPAMESYALEVTDEKEHDTIHTDLGLQDMDEKLLPKAIDHLYQNTESKMYQVCLKTRHGTAHLCVEKTRTKMQSARRSTATRHAHNRRVQFQDKRSEQYKQVAGDLLKLRVVLHLTSSKARSGLGLLSKTYLRCYIGTGKLNNFVNQYV